MIESVSEPNDAVDVQVDGAPPQPLLYAMRRYLNPLDSSSLGTSSCQVSQSPSDYGPDD